MAIDRDHASWQKGGGGGGHWGIARSFVAVQRPSKYHSNPAAGEQVNHEFMAEIQTELGRHGSHLAFTLLTHNRPTALI